MEIQLLYNVVLVSATQPSKSAICLIHPSHFDTAYYTCILAFWIITDYQAELPGYASETLGWMKLESPLPGEIISWLQSTSTVILEHPQNKDSHFSQCFPIYLP